MKTFDIALEYLKNVDFSKYDVYLDRDITSEENEFIIKEVAKILGSFNSDKRNTFSNENYRNVTCEACIHHLIDLAHNRASFWNVACEIIEDHISILETKFEGYTEGSDYPKIMTGAFIKYCDELSPQPNFLNEKSEVRMEFFMSAFHYIVDANS